MTHPNKTTLEYYILTERWLSDFEFFENELNFFEKLIKKNIIFSADDRYLVKLQQYLVRLNELTADKHNIHTAILGHIKALKSVIRGILADKAEEVSAEHEMLRNRIMGFINNYRLYKNQLYHAAEMLTGNTEPDLLLN